MSWCWGERHLRHLLLVRRHPPTPLTADEVFQVREDKPTPRIGAGLHRIP
jgi:hypothetical protein